MRGHMKVNAIGIGVEHARPRMWARSRSLVTKVIFECCVDVTRVNSPPPGDSTYHWYRAILIDPSRSSHLPAVTMPTLFLWPKGAGNVSRETAVANANYVTGPYRFEVLENARNFALQLEPERITELLVEHLAQHD